MIVGSNDVEDNNCGSCWAHSAVSSVESAIALFKQQKNVVLSVQQVLDCKPLGNTIDGVACRKIDTAPGQSTETCSKGGAASNVFTGLSPGNGQQNLVLDSQIPYLGKLCVCKYVHSLLVHGLHTLYVCLCRLCICMFCKYVTLSTKVSKLMLCTWLRRVCWSLTLP